MKLFEPGRIGGMHLKNRIVMAAMGNRGLCELDGRYNQRAIDYLVARARGGVGLITPGLIPASHSVESQLSDDLWSFRPRADNVVYGPRLNELANAMHQYGARICAQLTAGFGRVARTVSTSTIRSELVAPSRVANFWTPGMVNRALTLEEIQRLVEGFGNAARLLKMAEWDAIELHGHEGYLFDQFQTALWNRRKDRYGGDLDGRLTFAIEVIKEIRDAVGNDLAIIYRYGVRHYLEGGREVEEGVEMARRLEAAGVDALHVDAGCYDTWYWPHPPVYQPAGCMIDCAEVVKAAVKIPVIAVGKLGNPELAEKVLQEGKADFIALARPLLCDPEWSNKVRQGKYEDIVPCIGDHEGCMQRNAHAHYLSCTVNPQTGMEREYSLTPAERPRNVLVVGGGPGGLEAARVAALSGHHVTLWERTGKLGGNLIAASAPDFKADVRDLIQYFVTQVHKLGVEVVLGKEATAESVAEAAPDVVIVATGADPHIPDIAGVNRKNVVTAIDLLTGQAEVGGKVIIAGGGVTGCEVAVWLARKGKKVTIVEMLAKLIPEDVATANRMMLLKMVNDSGMDSLTNSKITGITGNGVIVDVNGGSRAVLGDSVVLAVGLTPRSALRQSLTGVPFQVVAIGDCVTPRKILNAIWEGFHASRRI
ncbi:MAG: FAD-dependent oxidoreductase [Chloroflexota bacterium]